MPLPSFSTELRSSSLWVPGIPEPHTLIFWLYLGVSTMVFSVMIYAIIQHHKTSSIATPFHTKTITDIIWTLIPFVILILMTIPATCLLINMHGLW